MFFHFNNIHGTVKHALDAVTAQSIVGEAPTACLFFIATCDAHFAVDADATQSDFLIPAMTAMAITAEEGQKLSVIADTGKTGDVYLAMGQML